MVELSSPSSPPVQHPPVMPGVMPPPPTVWPTVLGVIAIVLGVLGAMQGGLGLITPLFLDQFRHVGAAASSGAGGGGGGGLGFDMFAGVDQYRPWMIISSVATLVAGLWLVAAGILLTMRRRAAWLATLSWAALKCVVVLCSSMVSYKMGQAQLASMQQSGMNPAGMQGMMSIMSVLGTILGVAWGWALPIFMFIWFARSRIRREMATW